jgi:hypothetical protein
MGKSEMKKTAGHWALSGPGWAAEWNQGGESGFLSIATAADDDKAVATKALVARGSKYFVWAIWRLAGKTRAVSDQIGRPAQPWLSYGERGVDMKRPSSTGAGLRLGRRGTAKRGYQALARTTTKDLAAAVA